MATLRITTVLTLLFLTGCSSTYYSAMEKLGYAKRDLLVSRVESAQKSQEQTKEQFRSALEQFRSVVQFDGGKLEERYESLRTELERSEDQANKVRERIAAVENVADALFREWKNELDDYHSAALRRDSERKLDTTQDRYAQLLRAMKKAESKLDPVLNPLRDQVLFLKHNLNARAVSSLQSELGQVETNVDVLVADLENSIREADQFINELRREDSSL